jgi:hypothetical protein
VLLRARLAAAQAVLVPRRVLDAFKRLNGVDVAHLHAKAAGAAWAVMLFVLTPSVVAASLGSVLVWIMTAFVLVGAIVSSTGLVVAARETQSDPVLLRADLRRSLFGLGVELVGIVMMLVGIGLYCVTQAVLSASLPTGADRVALTVFAYYAGAQLGARLASVVHRRRKEAHLAGTIGGTT